VGGAHGSAGGGRRVGARGEATGAARATGRARAAPGSERSEGGLHCLAGVPRNGGGEQETEEQMNCQRKKTGGRAPRTGLQNTKTTRA
jgi:hypothetical protein